MKKHKIHLFKKRSVTIEETKNMFQHLIKKDLGTFPAKVIRFECECGEKQEFHLEPYEEDYMPEMFESDYPKPRTIN